MKYAIIFWITLFTLTACQRKVEPLDSPLAKHVFLGMTPTKTPRLLAPELLASPAEEYNGTFSLQGNEFYYTTDIPENAFITFTEMKADSSWTSPSVAAFSGTYSDYDPLFSPDGSKLYFSSSRPMPDNTNSRIWYVERIDGGWGEPQPVPLTDSGASEYYSSLTHKGDIYFNIWSKGDIFKAERTEEGYTITALDTIINAKANVGDPFISPEEDYLIFRGYGTPNLGRGDLYISFRIDGTWTAAENLGEPINSAAHEICPYVTPDGKWFIFASSRVAQKVEMQPLQPIAPVREKYRSHDNGELNIYYMSADFIREMQEKYMK
ncbi:hypothetical protein [Spongiimicrobium sp. 2-473A-2-J]|uniref:hypothetical protein n=1 Tax=Eudoraea algarum TaxID=3417568 RepID=UPI003D35FE1A